MLILSSIIVGLILAYWGGWQGSTLYQAGSRLQAIHEADEQAAAEYERGCRDGWTMGFASGVSAAKRVARNKQVLTELAAQRFAVGGARPNE